MPGICGYVKNDNSKSIKNCYRDLNLNEDQLVWDNTFIDDHIVAEHSHLINIKSNRENYFNNGIYIAIEGEKFNYVNIDFYSLLYESYRKKSLNNVLKNIDGYFNAVIYDSNIKKVLLITDRYGLRLLYYYYKDGKFAWNYSVTKLFQYDFIDYNFDVDQINCFLDLGYLLEDNTYHKDIKLIKPASILEFDIISKNLNQEYYWKWSKIKQQNISFKDSVERLGDIFLQAIDKRFNPNQNIGVSISGGLDSRAILAAINKLYPDFKGYSFTYGIPNCPDIEIAKDVVSKTAWEHEEFHFKHPEWFSTRVEKILQTDGMFSIQHMHGVEFLDEISQEIDININGFAGDLVCGGGWFNKILLNKRASSKNLRPFYSGYSVKCDIDNDFYDISHVEPHLYMNRVRRFTNLGIINTLNKIDHRLPFFDNDLIEFIFSISDIYRKNNKLYNAMLLQRFPEFFRDIPWQKTNRLITKSSKNYFLKKAIYQIIRKATSYSLKKNMEFVDYYPWLKEKRIAQFLEDILDMDNSFYQQYINIDFKEKFLIPHLMGIKDNSEILLRICTLELYFKKVIGK